MKKNNEEIIKYLSGSMNESERKRFEEKLETSEELDLEFQNTLETISGLNLKNIEADETYFNNLVPRVRQRLEKEKKFSLRKKIYYLAPALSIVLLVVLFYPRSNSIPDTNYKELAEVVVNNMTDKQVSEKYISDSVLDPSYNAAADKSDFTVGLENTAEKIPDSYIKLVDNSNAEVMRTLNNLPNEDLEKLYKELSNIKFQ